MSINLIRDYKDAIKKESYLILSNHLGGQQVSLTEKDRAFIDSSSCEWLDLYFKVGEEIIEKNITNLAEKKFFRFINNNDPVLDNMGINKENARYYLVMVKIFDLKLNYFNEEYFSICQLRFPHSTYSIRRKILELCSPYMTTIEAYTFTLSEENLKNRIYLNNPFNWVDERRQKHMLIYYSMINSTLRLFTLVQKPVIEVLRGNTGVGKTRFTYRRHSITILNSDQIKFFLRNETSLLNVQVHEEGSTLFKYFFKIIRKSFSHLHAVVEGRFSTVEDLDPILKCAHKFNQEIIITDIESSLLTSLIRVLARDPLGANPCPSLFDIIEGYKASIIYRKAFIELVKTHKSIVEYRLFMNDNQGNLILTALQIGKLFEKKNEELFDKSLSLMSDEKIEELVNQDINKDLLYAACKRNEITYDTYKKLLLWQGMTLAEAIDQHALGFTPDEARLNLELEKIWKKKYGTYKQEPFDRSWLSDYPQIYSFLETEHVLHVRGVDEGGRGTHWPKGKFSWGFDAKFNPEYTPFNASHAGFQMRLGYFIIPKENIDCLTCDTNLLKEIEVRKKGELVGYRFFVHPESYYHFKTLHDVIGIKFVLPEKSTFMGTPTSSYRTWVIRCVKKLKDGRYASSSFKNPPFMVKMGIAGNSNGKGKLLSSKTIKNSLLSQRDLNQKKELMEKNNFLAFPESIGLILKNIPNYPTKSNPELLQDNCARLREQLNDFYMDSGIIIREFPKQFFENKQLKFFSLSSLMSLERKKYKKIGELNKNNQNFRFLPLIYEVIYESIRQGEVESAKEFIEKYLIDRFMDFLELFTLRINLAFAPHAQNLCIVLNEKNLFYGFACRDFEMGRSSLACDYDVNDYSWNYRYHVIVKLFSVITSLCNKEIFWVPSGAPTQLNFKKFAKERSLFHYFVKDQHIKMFKVYNLLVSSNDRDLLLQKMDQAYINKLSMYFEISRLKIGKGLPAAEKGSKYEFLVLNFNKCLPEILKVWGWRESDEILRLKKIFQLPEDSIERRDTGFSILIEWFKRFFPFVFFNEFHNNVGDP